MGGVGMRITVLIENTSDGKLACEHGLSLWIRYGSSQILLDAGSTDAFLMNAAAMGIDLKQVDAAVLSHAHYDHSGGFSAFCNYNHHARIYLQKSSKEACYSLYQGKKRYLGIPETVLKECEDRFCYVEGELELCKGVWLLPHTAEGLSERGVKAHMFRKTRHGFTADDFSHEQSLVLETPRGLVLCSSCSHGGIDTIVKEVKKRFSGRKVCTVIGGFHLMTPGGISTLAYTPEEVTALGHTLFQEGVEEIYTGHCTGEPAFTILKEYWPERVHYLRTGSVLEWD